jgi:hypothetical protein
VEIRTARRGRRLRNFMWRDAWKKRTSKSHQKASTNAIKCLCSNAIRETEAPLPCGEGFYFSYIYVAKISTLL